MDAIGNEKKKLGESEIHNLRKRNPINCRTNNPLPTIPKNTPRIMPKRISLQIREAHQITPRRRTPISLINSAKTESSQAKHTRRFNNNLCLFCGGVGHTAKECPKSSSSVMKAKARTVQTKSDSTPVAEDTKKA